MRANLSRSSATLLACGRVVVLGSVRRLLLPCEEWCACNGVPFWLRGERAYAYVRRCARAANRSAPNSRALGRWSIGAVFCETELDSLNCTPSASFARKANKIGAVLATGHAKRRYLTDRRTDTKSAT